MERVYIRFGDLPEGGRSENFETYLPEAGTSVFAAEWDADDRRAVLVCADQCSAASIPTLSDRPAYLVTGTLCGTGADGEPLIADPTATPVDIADLGYVVDDWTGAWV